MSCLWIGKILNKPHSYQQCMWRILTQGVQKKRKKLGDSKYHPSVKFGLSQMNNKPISHKWQKIVYQMTES